MYMNIWHKWSTYSLEYPSKKELIEKERIFEQEVDNQPSKTTKGLSDKHQIASYRF